MRVERESGVLCVGEVRAGWGETILKTCIKVFLVLIIVFFLILIGCVRVL